MIHLDCSSYDLFGVEQLFILTAAVILSDDLFTCSCDDLYIMHFCIFD